MVERLGGDADYQSMQQFVADSPWEPALVVRAVAERVAPEIDVEAWVLDDTGFPKDGKDSPGVKRQYSGTLGKTGNCQIGVSVHAVGASGTVPLGWALYLPEDWCADQERRRKAKIPMRSRSRPSRSSGWSWSSAPPTGMFRRRRCSAITPTGRTPGCVIVSRRPGASTCCRSGQQPRCSRKGLCSRCLPKKPKATRGPIRPRPDRKPEPIGELISRLRTDAAQMVTFRDGFEGEPVTSRFVFARVHAAHGWRDDQRWTGWREGSEVPPREEWLIAEWPDGHDEPTDYWISNLPADTEPERLARLARMRWKVELDYKQLKGELGLDHYEGRSWLGWYHHTALVTAAHGFLTLERLNPFHPRPA